MKASENKISDTATAIYNMLGHGVENAIHMTTVAKRLGLPEDGREVRMHVQRMRNAGLLIGSGNEGYYIPRTNEEVERSRRRGDRQAKAILKRNKVFNRRLNEIEGQTKLDD